MGLPQVPPTNRSVCHHKKGTGPKWTYPTKPQRMDVSFCEGTLFLRLFKENQKYPIKKSASKVSSCHPKTRKRWVRRKPGLQGASGARLSGSRSTRLPFPVGGRFHEAVAVRHAAVHEDAEVRKMRPRSPHHPMAPPQKSGSFCCGKKHKKRVLLRRKKNTFWTKLAILKILRLAIAGALSLYQG